MVIRRPVGALAGLVAAALVLTACSSGPSQVGQAVIVGNSTVSVNQVQQELNDLLATQTAVKQAQQQGQLDQTSRKIVTSHVVHVLITKAAAQYHLSVSDQQVQQLISEAGGTDKVAQGLQVSAANARGAVQDLLLEVALARKFADTLTVNFGFVQATDRASAMKDAQQLAANPGSLNSLVQQANAAAQASGGQTGGQADTTFSVSAYLQGIAQADQQAQSQGQPAPTENDAPIFGTPANSVLAFQPDPTQSQTWIVALIKSRNPSGAKPPAGGSAADVSDAATLAEVGVSLLQPQVHQLGVRVSPRYGVWDSVGMQVVPSADQTIGVVFPVRSSQP